MGFEKESFIHITPKTRRFDVDESKINPVSLFSTSWLLHTLEPTRCYANGRLLDIGCGPKPYKEFYAAQQHIGVDWPSSAHSLAIDAFADAQSLPFSNESFDTVLCTEVMEHLRRPWVAIDEIRRVLKPGGYLILTAPFVHGLHEQPHDYFRFTGYGMLALARQSRLDLVAIWQRGGTLSVIFDQEIRLLATWLRAVMRCLHFPKFLQNGILKVMITLPQRLMIWLILSLAERSKKSNTPHLVNPTQLSLGYVLVARRQLMEKVL